MKKYYLPACVFLILLFQISCDDQESSPAPLKLIAGRIGSIDLSLNPGVVIDKTPANMPVILTFSSAVDTQSAKETIRLDQPNGTALVNFSFQEDDKTVLIDPVENLLTNTEYTLTIGDQLKGVRGESFAGLNLRFKTSLGQLTVLEWTIGGERPSGLIGEVPHNIDLVIRFSEPVDPATLVGSSVSLTGPASSPLQFDFNDNDRILTITAINDLPGLRKYKLVIDDKLKGAKDETFTGFVIDFYTRPDSEPKFPEIGDDALLTLVQQQTFKYFWDFAHPVSGMARERNTSGDIVTSGGTGFGIMALIVGIERSFITRAEGLERMDKILDFLETSDRFHGAWSHWLNGSTGDVVPFSANDNGGDLVETSFLVQGLITFRQYLNASVPEEQQMISRINALWEDVEWDWYTREGQDVLYWHWSPDKAWAMNHPIKGYNECLITYVLAASAPTHSIDADVYHKGWAGSGAIVNGRSFYDITLPLGFDYGGPLFFTHYSFLGLDPRNLQDTYANYWIQNVNHSRINHAYSVANPKGFIGYSDANWGLTASDNHQGYSAHSPTNDLGVITPTAALSSFPYTPAESLKALRFFYYTLGDRLWGEYGFYDAFNLTQQWTASSYLAIDQGPIIVMIENHRTGLLWDLFMSAPEVQDGLTKLSFTY